jgi:hypothetical protein
MPRHRRGAALAGVAAGVWAVTVACAAEPDEPDALQPNPWRERRPPDAVCPVTLPMSPGRHPAALRGRHGRPRGTATTGSG